MEENEDKINTNINGLTKHISFGNKKWNYVTVIDLSHNNLCELDDNIVLPDELCEINLSNNNLNNVPQIIMNLQHVKHLNLSFNRIEYFDDTPNFYNSITELNLSSNKLLGPPYWVWLKSPKHLQKLDLSNNVNITKSLSAEYIKELMQFKTLVNHLIIYNCRLDKNAEILCTFGNATIIELGVNDLCYMNINRLEEIPFQGLDKCRKIGKLYLCNTCTYTITSDIHIYNNITEIDLSVNKLCDLPKEFCSLDKLEVCILSQNSILYLPEEFSNLNKLRVLCIDSNELCMLPEKFNNLFSLRKLDLYDNKLYDMPNLEFLEEVDLALNYLDEPDNKHYVDKKNNLRLKFPNRCNGRKEEIIKSESECSYQSEDDDEVTLNDASEYINDNRERSSSSASEDWDSEEWWSPYYPTKTIPIQSQWHSFIQRKMKEGNFCPIDLHAVSIAEMVKYEKMCKPQVYCEVDGQFDDLSGNES